ncbi:hypothetical protein [Acinetobacter puyangensis]|uniref:hypothetical protein n=1 Tax=Acinetobacter puyangensis TaxID=1096779 RepID=UPI003A4D9794
MEKIEQIRKIATDVRQAMEELKISGKISPETIPFGRFPNGCCGDMSEILIQHFRCLGYGDADYMSGIYHQISSHAWIRLDGICIDITADQFNNRHYPERSFTFGEYSSVIVEYEKDYPLSKIFLLDKEPSTREYFNKKIYNLIKQRLNLE